MSSNENTFKPIKTKFKAWLKKRKRGGLIADNTLEAYLATIDYFLNSLIAKKILRLNDLEISYLEQFIKIKHAKTNKAYASGTQKVRAAALSAFFDWAYQHGYCRINWGLSYKISHTQKRYYQDKKKPVPILVPSILNQKEVHKLLNNSIEQDDFNFTRNQAVIALMLTSGLYTHEICALTEKAVDTKKHILKIANKKGDIRYIPLDSSLYYKPFKQWLKFRKIFLGKQKHLLLFFSTRFNPLSQRTLHHIVTGQLERAGIAKPQKGSDVLRQTAIVMKLAQGLPMDQVRAMMGLNALITMDRYLSLVKYFMGTR